MQVQKTTIESLFTHERRYMIPLFQRPYVWTQEGQWEPLWEDLQSLAARELDAIRSGAPSDDHARPHFMGAIVLQPYAVTGDHLPALDVIDGQQRLTTLQLFLVVLRDVAKLHNDAATERWARSRTENQNVLVDEEVERFKLWPTQRDQAQFREVWGAAKKGVLDAKYPLRIGRRKAPRPVMVEAYTYFHDAICEWIAEVGDAAVCAKALRMTLQKRLELVQIDLDANENPQEIFETLNARGVPLLASDLLRNHIFHRAKDAARMHQQYWARFDAPSDPSRPDGERFWEVEERQGRLSRARLDLFVQHYLAMKLGRDVRISELFREYKAWIEDKRPFADLDAELTEFTRYADLFVSLLRPAPGTRLGVFVARLRALDLNSIYPLVLTLLGEAALPATERDGIFTDLESFVVRRAVCGRPTNNYTRKFLELARDFRQGGVFTRIAFRALLGRDTSESFDWPSDVAFETKWNVVDAYTALKPARVEMILRAIELASRSPKSEPVTLTGTLTIEHVMPRGWEAHWPLPAGADAAKAREGREEVVHDFGNLTLMTQELNSSVSNGPAAQKLPEIVKHSNLELSKWFIGRTTWTEDDIRERGKALFKTAAALWPRG
jgi:hypothetical protein